MCNNMLFLIAAAQSKLQSDFATQVDLTADGEYLYTACSSASHCMHT